MNGSDTFDRCAFNMLQRTVYNQAHVNTDTVHKVGYFDNRAWLPFWMIRVLLIIKTLSL